MKRLYFFLLCAICLANEFTTFAQVDLSAQRAEDQTVNAVSGSAQSRALVINPTPQSLVLNGGTLDASAGFAVKSQLTDDVPACIKQNPKGVKLTIDFGKKKDLKPLSGAYSLTVTPNGISIQGYDERGAFYGLQTLLQILESTPAASIPLLTITDYPSLEHRGVVEGFYGTPWSHKVRMSLIDFYGRHKMNTYIYGPKDDPYHSSPNWRLPYPADQAANISELIEACRRNYVDFVWAIHPGKDIRWDKEDYDNLVNKFQLMYDLGVRHFAIFFDDIEGEGTNPNKQVKLLNDLTDDFVKKHPGVAPLMVCPTEYSRLWLNPTDKGANAIYGRTLYPEIDIMYTGDVVCSDLTKDTMDFFNSLIKRPGYYWWNWPVTDYARNYILQGPAYGLDTSLTSADVTALVSNPMEHGEASKLALYGVADYAWNIPAFNSIDNWERGLRELMPECPEAYRTFAIHSCDTETGYRRSESWETEPFRFTNDWTPEQLKAMRDEFARATIVPNVIRQNCSNKLLLAELEPWLAEFEKLGQRGLKVCYIMENFDTLSDIEVFQLYRSAIMNAAETEAYNAHKVGTMKLQPFYDNAITDLRDALQARRKR